MPTPLTTDSIPALVMDAASPLGSIVVGSALQQLYGDLQGAVTAAGKINLAVTEKEMQRACTATCIAAMQSLEDSHVKLQAHALMGYGIAEVADNLRPGALRIALSLSPASLKLLRDLGKEESYWHADYTGPENEAAAIKHLWDTIESKGWLVDLHAAGIIDSNVDNELSVNMVGHAALKLLASLPQAVAVDPGGPGPAR